MSYCVSLPLSPQLLAAGIAGLLVRPTRQACVVSDYVVLLNVYCEFDVIL